MSADQDLEALLDHLEAEKAKGNTLTVEEEERLAELRTLIAETSDALLLYHSFDVDQKWKELEAIATSRGLTGQAAPQKAIRLWPRVALIASITFAVFGAGIFYYSQNGNHQKQAIYANDVPPGRQGATLTLANGKKILINEVLAGNIAIQSGVKISKTANGQLIYEVTDSKSGLLQYNTLSTAPGQQTQVRLPDGTNVYLNAASSLKYPTSFGKQQTRRVSLTGEGYFEVSKDKLHPFVVETNKQQVEVLGTHFNINAYEDELAVATTLLEGSVKVTSGGKQLLLKPGFQAINDGVAFKTEIANIESTTDWKDGDFSLDGLDLKSVMRKIARWYDVEVVYTENISDDITSVGMISRDKRLSSILGIIEASGQVKFKIEGRKVYVSR